MRRSEDSLKICLSLLIFAGFLAIATASPAADTRTVLDVSRVLTEQITIDTSLPLKIVSPANGQRIKANNRLKLTVEGVTEPFQTVFFKENFEISLGSVQADNSGHFVFSPERRFETGKHILSATAEDAAGNVSTSVVTFFVDPLKAWYVSAQDGDDLNSGDVITAPFKTIQQALQVMKSEDNVFLLPGTYEPDTFVIRPSQSGSSFKKTLIAAFPGAEGRVRVKVPSARLIIHPDFGSFFSSGGFSFSDIQNVTIRGIEFFGAARSQLFLITSSRNIDFINNRFKAAHDGVEIFDRRTDEIIPFKMNGFDRRSTNIGQTAVTFTFGSNIHFYNNRFENFWGFTSVFDQVDSVAISSNTFLNCGASVSEGRVRNIRHAFNNFEDMGGPTAFSASDTFLENFERFFDGSVHAGVEWRPTPNDIAVVSDDIDLDGDGESDSGRISFFNSVYDAFDPFGGEPPPPPPPARWYVSPTLGGDDQPGNDPARPFKTIARAFQIAGPKDAVYLLPGVYEPAELSFPDTMNGSFGDHALFAAAPGFEGRAVIKIPSDGFIFDDVHHVTIRGIEFLAPPAFLDGRLVNIFLSHQIDLINNRFIGPGKAVDPPLALDMAFVARIRIQNNTFDDLKAVNAIFYRNADGVVINANSITNVTNTALGFHTAAGSSISFNNVENVGSFTDASALQTAPSFKDNFVKLRDGRIFTLSTGSWRTDFNDTALILGEMDVDGDGHDDSGRTSFYVGAFDSRNPFINAPPTAENLSIGGDTSFLKKVKLPAPIKWRYVDPDRSHQTAAHLQFARDPSFAAVDLDQILPLFDISSAAVPAILSDISRGPWFFRMSVSDDTDFGPFTVAPNGFVFFRTIPPPVLDPLPSAVSDPVVTLAGSVDSNVQRVKIFRGLDQLGDVPVVNGRFSLPNVTLTEDGNEFIAIGVDELNIEGDPSTSVHTVLDRRTPSPLADPVRSPTNRPAAMLSGIAEAGSSITFDLNDQPQSPQTTPGLSPIFADAAPEIGLVGRSTGVQFGSKILFEEDFSDTSPFVPSSGDWILQNGSLNQTNAFGEFYASLPNSEFTDFVFEGTIRLDISPEGDRQAWLLFRRQDDGNFYGFGYRGAEGPKFELWQKRFGGFQELAEMVPSFSVVQGIAVRLKIEVRGNRIQCKAWPESDSEPAQFQIDVTSTTLSRGGIGLRTSNMISGFDNLSVRAGDYLSAEVSFELPVQSLERVEMVRPTALVRDGSIDLKAFLPAIADNFDDRAAADFTEVRGVWTFQNGGYLLNAGGIANWQAVSRTNRTFGDFEVEVDINALSGQFPGVNFRMDAAGQNFYTVYYRIGFGDVAFEYTENGSRFPNAFGVAPLVAVNNEFHRLKIRAEGQRIRIWVDGNLKFDVMDGRFSSGHIGLTAFGFTQVLFDRLLVSEKSAIDENSVISVSERDTLPIVAVLSRPSTDAPGPFLEHVVADGLAKFFSDTMTLQEGVNHIRIGVTDRAGNSNDTEIEIILDQMPPEIIGLKAAPNPFTPATSSTRISFTAADNFPQFGGRFSAAVFDQNDAPVASLLADSPIAFGAVSVEWDGRSTKLTQIEDFDNAAAQFFTPTQGNWTFSNGGYVLDADGIPNWQANSKTNQTYGDFDMEVDINALSGSFPGVNFRMDASGQNFYTVYYRVGSGDMAFEFTQNGARITNFFGFAPLVAVNNEVHRLRIQAEGQKIKIWVDGVLKFDATDSHFSEGHIALTAFAGTQALFDNFLVTSNSSGSALTPVPDGTYKIRVSLADAADNTQTDVVFVTVGGDAIAPRFTRFSPAGGETFVAKRDTIVISVAAVDNTDPFPTVFARLAHFVGSTSDTALTVVDSQQIAPLSIPAGQWKLVATAKDAAGNIRTQEGGFFTVIHDVLPPRTTLAVGDPAFVRISDNATYVTAATPLVFTAVDDLVTVGDSRGLGVSMIKVVVDSGVFVTVTNTMTLGGLGAGGEGKHTVSYRATDVVGNIEPDRLSILYIDATAPVTTDTKTPPANKNGWNASAVSVALSAADPVLADGSNSGSGVKETRLGIDGATPVVSNTAALISSEGIHTLAFFSVDNIGNTETAKADTVNIDLTKPVITLRSITPDSTGRGSDGRSWWNKAVTVTFSESDALSGLDPARSVSVFTLPNEGKDQSVMAVAADKADNTSTLTANGINIDFTAPNVSLTVGTPKVTDIQTYVTSQTLVTVVGSDTLSGMKQINITTQPPGLFVSLTQTNEAVSGNLAQEGQIMATFSGTDIAANKSSDQTASLIVDNTAPTTTFTVDITDTTGAVLIPQSEITLFAVDGPALTPAVGVNRIEYRFDSGNIVTAPGSTTKFDVSGLPFGSHTLTFQSFDRLANAEPVKTFTFTVSPALSASKVVSFAPRVLVWLNDKDKDGDDHGDDEGEDEEDDEDGGKGIPAANLTALKSILDSAPILLYDIVNTSDSFVALMRTDSYNVYFIIGDQEHLKKERAWELSERVRMGDGLVSSSLAEIDLPVQDKGEHEGKDGDKGHDENEHGGDDDGGGKGQDADKEKDNKAAKNLLGVDVDGKHSDKDIKITLAGAAIPYIGDYQTTDKTKQVRALAATALGDGFVTPKGKTPEPTVVSNGFGSGKTVFFAFDVGLSAAPSNSGPTERLLNAAMRKVTPTKEVFIPDGRAAIGIGVQSLVVPLNLAVRIEEALPAGATAVNKLDGDVQGNAILWNLTLDVNESDTVNYVLGLPTTGEANVTTSADVSYLVRGNYILLDTLKLTVVTEKDLPGLLDAAITRLNALSPSNKKVEEAVEELQSQRASPPVTKKQIEDNIEEVLNIIRDLDGLDADPQAIGEARDTLDKIVLIYGRRMAQG